MDHAYTPPVAQLLTLGDPPPHDQASYESFDFTVEHVPELLRLAADLALFDEGDPDNPPTDTWAPIHAWRVLGRLKAVDALATLLRVTEPLHDRKDGIADWYHEEIQHVAAEMGPPAIPALQAYLTRCDAPVWSRISAAEALSTIADRFPDHRDRVVAILTATLANPLDNPEDVNAHLVAFLIDLEAIESLSIIRNVYASGHIDAGVCGQYRTVCKELGAPDTGDDPPDVPDSNERLRDMTRLMLAKMRLARLMDAAPADFPPTPARPASPPQRKQKDRKKRKKR